MKHKCFETLVSIRLSHKLLSHKTKQQHMQHTRRITMSFLTQKTKPLLLAIAALSLTMAASCELPAADGVINFELTGQVLIKDTNEPVEGAYVLAVYEKVELGGAGASRNCVKTKGMMSDKEGRFHFPVEKLDGNSPHMVYAIKPDHYFYLAAIPSDKVWKAQNKETYTNRHVYLKKQDPAKPDFQFGYGECARPESAQAAEANIQFLEFERAELIRLGSQFDWFKNSIETTDRRIKRLQSAPDRK
jgi:hypothetical protein